MYILFITTLWSISVPLNLDAITSYRGQTVLSVSIHAPPDEEIDVLRSLVDIYPGYILATEDVQEAIKRLYALGRFSDVGVSAERWSGTVRLHFFMRKIKRLQTLEIEGLQRISPDQLQEALALTPGDEVDSRSPERIRLECQIFLEKSGFPQAQISIQEKIDAPSNLVSYRLLIKEGPPIRLASISFTGHPRLSKQLLQSITKLEKGQIFDQKRLALAYQSLQKSYREHGFLLAEFSEPEVRQKGPLVFLRFHIMGNAHVTIQIHDNQYFDLDEFLKLWPTPSGPLHDSDLEMFVERIRKQYIRLGYFQAQVRYKKIYNPGLNSLNIHILIQSSPEFRVRQIHFKNVQVFSPEVLIQQIQSLLQRELTADTFTEKLSPTDLCLRSNRSLTNTGTRNQKCPRAPIPVMERWIPELYEKAMDEIRFAYRALGYRQVEIDSPQALIEEQDVEVTINITEGNQTTISDLSFRGNHAFSAASLLHQLNRLPQPELVSAALGPGAPFYAIQIEDGRIALLRRYRDAGYLYAKVFTQIVFSTDQKNASVAYEIEEGPQVRVKRILLSGNRFTRDGIIRSRLETEPGDLYRLDQALEDQRSVAELGVFSNVRVKLIDEEKPAEYKDLVTEVKERNRQPVEIVFGASSADGPRMQASYSHINVWGTASRFTSALRINRQILFGLYGDYQETMAERYNEFDAFEQIERELRLSLKSPPWKTLFFDPEARIDLVHERENNISFSFDSIAAILGIDFKVAKKLSLSLEPSISLTNLICDDESCASKDIRITEKLRHFEEGLLRTFKVGPTLTLDLRDNPMNPHFGLFAFIRAFRAVGYQATERFSFNKYELTLTGYLPVKNAVLAISVRGGLIDKQGATKKIPKDERFYLGGRNTLRGFPEGGTLIPENVCVVYKDASRIPDCAEIIERDDKTPPLTAGGDLFFLTKAEFRFPLFESLSLGIFIDAGNLWVAPTFNQNLNFVLRIGTGAGLRYETPIGPLALDFGVNTVPRRINGEPTSPLPHFSVGVF